MEIAAKRIEADIKRAAEPYSDTGATIAGIHVDVYGGPGRGFRNVGMIAVSETESSEWLDKGTGPQIRRPSGRAMPVGARSPNRPNAGQYAGQITQAKVVDGQKATRFFSAPTGPPLGIHMRNVFAGLYRRAR